jgi:glycosyltransferase involved in cell wall biosynthesis
MKPKVSVIIPNFNHGRFLHQRIDTVLNQTYPNFEVIILDDCSGDDSQAVIELYRSHPAVSRIEINSINTGSPFVQWRKGIAMAQGEWIWIAESDDYAELNFLETMISSFPDNDNLGLVYCDSFRVVNDIVQPETFASLKNERLNTFRWSHNHINNGIDEIQDFLMAHGTINNTSAVLFKRDVLLKTNPFDIPFRFMGDKYAFIKVLSVSDIRYVNKPLNYYRAAPDSKPKHNAEYIDYIYEQFLIFDWIDKNLPFVNDQKFLQAFLINTENSLIRNWSRKKIIIYGKFLKLNRKLFLKAFRYNLQRIVKKIIN